jgi:TRAP-type C4-dicarboxylate transport system permease small subunit
MEMNYIFAFVNKIENIITIIERNIAMIGIWVCTILVFFGVVNRYLLHLPIMWIDDLSVYIFVFYLFISIALTCREDMHLRIDVFRNKLFRKNSIADSVYAVLLRIISIIILCFFVSPVYRLFLQAKKYPEYGSLVRWFNTSWLRYVVLLMVILMLMHLFRWLVKEITILIKAIRTK